MPPEPTDQSNQQELKALLRDFHGNGFFPWQFSDGEQKRRWEQWRYDEEAYWGGFSRAPFDPVAYRLPDWAIGPFTKHPGNPIFAPDPNGWDCGHFGGGVHNGSILKRNGRFYYVYRGEFPMPDEPRFASRRATGFDYLCDIGVAVSDDGIHFERIAGPLLRRPKDWMFSFEDVCCVEHEGRYYMFINRWDWAHFDDPSLCGTYLAISDDLVHWEHKGLVFPNAKRIHRNAAVVQDPDNHPVRDAQGRFVMYINNGLIAYSDDMLHWESRELDAIWPGGECAVAIARCGMTRIGSQWHAYYGGSEYYTSLATAPAAFAVSEIWKRQLRPCPQNCDLEKACGGNLR